MPVGGSTTRPWSHSQLDKASHRLVQTRWEDQQHILMGGGGQIHFQRAGCGLGVGLSCFVFFLSGCTGEQQTHTAAQSLGPFVGFGTGTHPRDHQHNHEYSPHPDGLEKSRPTSAGPRGTGVGDTPHSAPATASELSAAWLRSREDLLLCEDCVRRTRTQAQTGRKGLQRTHPTKDRSPKYIKTYDQQQESTQPD